MRRGDCDTIPIYDADDRLVNVEATTAGGDRVSRYFKFKNRDDLAREAESLGLDVPLQADPAPLAEAIRVGDRPVGNRLAIQPMEGCDGDHDGAPGELTLRRFQRFGAGGAKLIWGEACAVVPEARANPRQLVLSDRNAPAIGRLIAACRQAHREAIGDDGDLLIGLQLTHSGRYCQDGPILVQHDPLLKGLAGSLISDDDLERLRDHYVAAAKRAFAIGCDFVDVKQCHRYLLSELLSAKTRPGRFGGSFEGSEPASSARSSPAFETRCRGWSSPRD